MARQPTPIAEILADLMARRGFARVQSAEAVEQAWREAVAQLDSGDLIAEHTRVGKIRRGQLEVTVHHSVLIQELEFQKQTLLKYLNQQLPELGIPDQQITDLRFRLGPTK